MATVHTPGPWYITGEEDRRYIREEASDVCIALMLDGGHVDPKFAMPEKEIAANARLIAAAPDLLAALEGMLRLDDLDAAKTHRVVYERAQAAIAKARGEAA